MTTPQYPDPTRPPDPGAYQPPSGGYQVPDPSAYQPPSGANQVPGAQPQYGQPSAYPPPDPSASYPPPGQPSAYPPPGQPTAYPPPGQPAGSYPPTPGTPGGPVVPGAPGGQQKGDCISTDGDKLPCSDADAAIKVIRVLNGTTDDSGCPPATGDSIIHHADKQVLCLGSNS